MSHCVTLLTGSNAEFAEDILQHTAVMLSETVGRVESASRIYTSEPWGFSAERVFCNQALRLITELGPTEVLDAVLAVEQAIGRRREEEQTERERTGQQYASRVVDVDVMFYDSEVISTPRLTVPHPLLHRRAFALRPLCEIMGEQVHPVLGRRLNDILADLDSGRNE